MQENPFKPGDLVSLRSGGVACTVTRITEIEGEPACGIAYFDGNQNLFSTTIPTAALIDLETDETYQASIKLREKRQELEELGIKMQLRQAKAANNGLATRGNRPPKFIQ